MPTSTPRPSPVPSISLPPTAIPPSLTNLELSEPWILETGTVGVTWQSYGLSASQPVYMYYCTTDDESLDVECSANNDCAKLRGTAWYVSPNDGDVTINPWAQGLGRFRICLEGYGTWIKYHGDKSQVVVPFAYSNTKLAVALAPSPEPTASPTFVPTAPTLQPTTFDTATIDVSFSATAAREPTSLDEASLVTAVANQVGVVEPDVKILAITTSTTRRLRQRRLFQVSELTPKLHPSAGTSDATMTTRSSRIVEQEQFSSEKVQLQPRQLEESNLTWSVVLAVQASLSEIGENDANSFAASVGDALTDSTFAQALATNMANDTSITLDATSVTAIARTRYPTPTPSHSPSLLPSPSPSHFPSPEPSPAPSQVPSNQPTSLPTTRTPTSAPVPMPSNIPAESTLLPTVLTTTDTSSAASSVNTALVLGLSLAAGCLALLIGGGAFKRYQLVQKKRVDLKTVHEEGKEEDHEIPMSEAEFVASLGEDEAEEPYEDEEVLSEEEDDDDDEDFANRPPPLSYKEMLAREKEDAARDIRKQAAAERRQRNDEREARNELVRARNAQVQKRNTMRADRIDAQLAARYALMNHNNTNSSGFTSQTAPRSSQVPAAAFPPVARMPSTPGGGSGSEGLGRGSASPLTSTLPDELSDHDNSTAGGAQARFNATSTSSTGAAGMRRSSTSNATGTSNLQARLARQTAQNRSSLALPGCRSTFGFTSSGGSGGSSAGVRRPSSKSGANNTDPTSPVPPPPSSSFSPGSLPGNQVGSTGRVLSGAMDGAEYEEYDDDEDDALNEMDDMVHVRSSMEASRASAPVAEISMGRGHRSASMALFGGTDDNGGNDDGEGYADTFAVDHQATNGGSGVGTSRRSSREGGSGAQNAQSRNSTGRRGSAPDVAPSTLEQVQSKQNAGGALQRRGTELNARLSKQMENARVGGGGLAGRLAHHKGAAAEADAALEAKLESLGDTNDDDNVGEDNDLLHGVHASSQLAPSGAGDGSQATTPSGRPSVRLPTTPPPQAVSFLARAGVMRHAQLSDTFADILGVVNEADFVAFAAAKRTDAYANAGGLAAALADAGATPFEAQLITDAIAAVDPSAVDSSPSSSPAAPVDEVEPAPVVKTPKKRFSVVDALFGSSSNSKSESFKNNKTSTGSGSAAKEEFTPEDTVRPLSQPPPPPPPPPPPAPVPAAAAAASTAKKPRKSFAARMFGGSTKDVSASELGSGDAAADAAAAASVNAAIVASQFSSEEAYFEARRRASLAASAEGQAAAVAKAKLQQQQPPPPPPPPPAVEESEEAKAQRLELYFQERRRQSVAVKLAPAPQSPPLPQSPPVSPPPPPPLSGSVEGSHDGVPALSKAEKQELRQLKALKDAGELLNPANLQRYRVLKNIYAASKDPSAAMSPTAAASVSSPVVSPAPSATSPVRQGKPTKPSGRARSPPRPARETQSTSASSSSSRPASRPPSTPSTRARSPPRPTAPESKSTSSSPVRRPPSTPSNRARSPPRPAAPEKSPSSSSNPPPRPPPSAPSGRGGGGGRSGGGRGRGRGRGSETTGSSAPSGRAGRGGRGGRGASPPRP